MNRVFKTVLLIANLFIAGQLYATAETTLIDDIRYTINFNDGTASIEQQWFDDREYIKNAVIPESIEYKGKKYPVVALGENALYGCKNMESVIVPPSVKSIGEDAFRNCRGLTEVSLPMDLPSLSEGIFDGCSSLETIELPKKITSIPHFAFSNCKSLKSITIPDKVETIESQSFEYCTRLREIHLPPSVVLIDGELTDASDATVYISDLKAFCDIQVSYHGIAGNIGWFLNLNGKEVTELIIPDGVESMYIFHRCRSLISITTPKSLKYCQFDNSNLETITMSSATKKVDISGCDNLKTINLYAVTPPELAGWIKKVYVHVPKGTKALYEADENWSKCYAIIDDLPNESGIDDVIIDNDSPVTVYDLSGNIIADTLEGLDAGIYIVRQGESIRKIIVQ